MPDKVKTSLSSLSSQRKGNGEYNEHNLCCRLTGWNGLVK